MHAKNLGTIAPISTLTNFYASLLTISNMAAVGHFGKVFVFVSYSYNVHDFGTQNSFLMLFSSFGLIFMLSYVPNPIWRPSAILEVIFFVPYSIFTCNTSIITNFGMQNSFLMLFFIVGGPFPCLHSYNSNK